MKSLTILHLLLLIIIIITFNLFFTVQSYYFPGSPSDISSSHSLHHLPEAVSNLPHYARPPYNLEPQVFGGLGAFSFTEARPVIFCCICIRGLRSANVCCLVVAQVPETYWGSRFFETVGHPMLLSSTSSSLSLTQPKGSPTPDHWLGVSISFSICSFSVGKSFEEAELTCVPLLSTWSWSTSRYYESALILKPLAHT